MKITVREREYLCLVGLGFENDMIGKFLCVEKSTVKKTLGKIYEKLNAMNRSNAVAIGFMTGILTEDVLREIRKKYGIETGMGERVDRY